MDKSDPMTPAPQDQSLELPEWLTPATTPDPTHAQLVAQAKRDKRAMEVMRYEGLFERVIDAMCSGSTLSAAVREEAYGEVDVGRFNRWIHADETRKVRYDEACLIRSYVWADRIVDHAVASDSMEDVGRSTLIVNSYWKLIASDNRKRYGETKQIEQNVTINLTDAMAEANARLERGRTVDVQGRLIDG
jgi:hypothetical protein